MCYLCQNALFFAYLIQVPVIIDIKNWFVVLKTRSEFDKFVNWRWYLNDLDQITFQYHVIQGSNYIVVWALLNLIMNMKLPVLEPNLYSQLLD